MRFTPRWRAFPHPLRDPTIDFPDEVMAARLRNLADARLRDMDAAGVDVQVLSLIAPEMQSLTAADAVSVARTALSSSPMPSLSVRQAYDGDLDEQLAMMTATSAVDWHDDGSRAGRAL